MMQSPTMQIRHILNSFFDVWIYSWNYLKIALELVCIAYNHPSQRLLYILNT